MTRPMIAVDGVQRTFGTTTALAIDRLVLPPGTVALLGPNGAGKTTLLRMLATVASVPSGSVVVDGDDIADPANRTALRRRLGYVGQRDTLPDRMRVSEFLDYVAALKEIGPRRLRRRWADHVLDQVGLASRSEDRISSLSGGMRRRLMIAQSFLGSPEVLLLDEPLVSLDAEHRSALVRLIAASAQERTTVVATHHSDELAAVCRHVVVLVGGRAQFQGPPNELAERARGHVWETATPSSDPTVRALGPDRFRIVGPQPAGGVAVDPTVHDGYLATLVAAADVRSRG